MVCFNAYSSSMGYPPRSIYIERLKKFAKDLMKTGEGKERKKERGKAADFDRARERSE